MNIEQLAGVSYNERAKKKAFIRFRRSRPSAELLPMQQGALSEEKNMGVEVSSLTPDKKSPGDNPKQHVLRGSLQEVKDALSASERLTLKEYPHVIQKIPKKFFHLRRESDAFSPAYTFQFWGSVGIRTVLLVSPFLLQGVPGGAIGNIVLSFLTGYLISPGSRALLKNYALAVNDTCIKPLADLMKERDLTHAVYRSFVREEYKKSKQDRTEKPLLRLRAKNIVAQQQFFQENASAIQSYADDIRRVAFPALKSEAEVASDAQSYFYTQAAKHVMDNYFARTLEKRPLLMKRMEEEYLHPGEEKEQYLFLAYKEVKKFEKIKEKKDVQKKHVAQLWPVLKTMAGFSLLGMLAHGEIQQAALLLFEMTKSISKTAAIIALANSLLYRSVISRGLIACTLARQEVLQERKGPNQSL